MGHRAGPAGPAAPRLPRPGRPLGQPRGQPARAGRRGPAGAGPGPVAGARGHRGRGRDRQRPARAGRRPGGGHRRAGHGPVPGPAGGPGLAAPDRLQRGPEPGLGHLRAVRDRHRGHRHLRAGVRGGRPPPVGAGLRRPGHRHGRGRAADRAAPLAPAVRGLGRARLHRLPHLVRPDPLRPRRPRRPGRPGRAVVLGRGRPGHRPAHLLGAAGGRLRPLRARHRGHLLGHRRRLPPGPGLVLRPWASCSCSPSARAT